MAGKETEMQELMPEEVAATVPPLYATEYDPATGETFGLIEGLADEWGYFSIPEFEALNRAKGFGVIERDEHFEPAPVREVRR